MAGDFDLLRPLYKMYMSQLPVMRERSRRWYKHNGTRFAETSYFYGSFEPVDYGCQRKPTDAPDPVSPYIKNHIQGGVELATIMLRDYQHTSNATLLAETVLPWCQSLLEFYDEHFPKYSNGTLFLQHAQSCETWPDCDNPAAQVAALIRITEGLTSIPRHLLSAEQAAFFARIAKSLPAIPLTDAKNGQPQISPCEGGFPSRHVNGENVETCKCSRSLCVFFRSSKKAAAQTLSGRESHSRPTRLLMVILVEPAGLVVGWAGTSSSR